MKHYDYPGAELPFEDSILFGNNNSGSGDYLSLLASELHDGTCHKLLEIKLLAHRLGNFADSPPEAREILNDLKQTAASAFDEVRSFSHALSAHKELCDGLIPALQSLVNRTNIFSPVRITITVEGNIPQLPKDIELHVYRICQECIANSIKHSAARNARLTLSYGPSSLQVILRDDGRGLPPSAMIDPGSFYFLNKRVKAVQGILDILPSEGHGAILSIIIPLPEDLP